MYVWVYVYDIFPHLLVLGLTPPPGLTLNPGVNPSKRYLYASIYTHLPLYIYMYLCMYVCIYIYIM